SITRDNITTLYGKDNNSRIFDPADLDPVHPTRIFSWLICQSYDDKGNAIIYEYQSEDSPRIYADQHEQFSALARQRKRHDATQWANCYLKRIKYGNRTPYCPILAEDQPPTPLPSEWLFEVVFDYGEHDPDAPMAEGSGTHWPRRNDPFSSYRAG